MKDQKKKKPGVKVVEEDDDAVVRIGDEEQPVLLDGVPKRDRADVDPRRLDLETKPTYEVRSEEPTADKILDMEELEAPDEAMEKKWGGEAKGWMVIPWGWFVLVALGCGGLAVWSLQQIRENQPEAIKAAQAKVAEIELKEQMRQAEAKKLYERLEARVQAYLAADSIPELLKHVREPERVEPLMKKWYAKHPLKAVGFEKFYAFRPVTLERRPFWTINAKTADGPRSLLVEQTGDDDGRIDWETDVCYQPTDWESFVTGRPEGKFDFRVRAKRDLFYAHEFADDKRYRCLRLTTRGSDEYLFGYVLRGSEAERLIFQAAGRFRKPVSVILRLGFLPGSRSERSVMIYEVTSKHWCLFGEKPADAEDAEEQPAAPQSAH